MSDLLITKTRIALGAAGVLFLLAFAGTAEAAPLPGSSYDSGDGNEVDGAALDWQSAVSEGRVAHNPDPSAQDTCFVGGSKENSPNTWAFDTSPGGCTPGKSNVLAAWAALESTPLTSFSHFAFLRNDTSGNSFFTFELNQSQSTWTNAAGTTIPCRQNGDLLLSFDTGGGTSLNKWVGNGTGPASCPNGASGSFVSSGNVSASSFQASMNTAGAIQNFLNPSSYGSSFPVNSFGEAAINLPAVLQGMGEDPCFGYLQMQVHTRSSSSITSALIDTTTSSPVYIQSCAATGHKYQDSNADGDRDSGEPGLAGFTFYVDLDDDGTKDAGEPEATSDADGFYRILDVPSGDHTIREVEKDGYNCTDPSPCFYDRTFTTTGNSTGNDFGNSAPSTASGLKFEDLDADGVQDLGEQGLADFEFYADLNNNGVLDPDEPSDVSDGTGAFTITGIESGIFAIREVARANWTCSLPTPCSYTEGFSSGSAVSGLTFANHEGATISGNLFEDLNGDGDPKEGADTNLSGWQVYIDANGNDSFDVGETEVQTDAQGDYSFTGLEPGNYTVGVTPASPSWYCASPAGCEYSVDLTSGEVVADRNFGFTRFATVSGTKFDDTSNNGVKDGGETGAAGFVFYVDYDNDDVLDAGEPSATSAATTGAWTITGVRAGDYAVREVPQAGWTCTKPASTCRYDLSITSNGTYSGNEFGNFIVRSVSGTVFRDNDADGLAREGGEPGVAGWRVYADQDNDSVFDAGEPSDISNDAGFYILTGLGNGNYRLRMVQQAGWTCSFPAGCLNTGSLGAGAGASDAGKDFGVWGPAAISGNLFEDTDADGDPKEAGEANLSGRTVYVDANGNSAFDVGEKNATTDAQGDYTLTELNPGTYTVRQVLPAGWTCSSPNPCSYSVAVSGANVENRDFGSSTTGSIAGEVFEDLDADGEPKEGGEPSLDGRTVYLDADDDGALDPGETSTTSGPSGAYSFSGLAPGTYEVRQVLPAGWTESRPSGSYSVTVTSGASTPGRDFGSYTTGDIAGMLFEDTDFDRSAFEPGDSPLAGRTVYIDTNNDGDLDAGEPSVTTDGSGLYNLTGLEPGTYDVRQVLPANWAGPYPKPNVYSVDVTSGSSTMNRDFGSYLGASVSGIVFEDLDADGAPREAGEGVLEGQRVYLDGNLDGVRDPDDPTTLTDASGAYSFTGIEVQTWQARLDLAAGSTCDTPAPCRYDLTLTSGANETSKDFGVHTTGSISGHLYTDRDNDGAPQEFGENDQPGRTVYVDTNDDGDLDAGEPETVTDDNGDFTIDGLEPGVHRVRQVLPSGWTCSTPDPCSHQVTLESGEEATGADFSSWTTAEFSGKVFEDLDGDGAFREDGEPGLPGETVYLDEDDDGVLDAGEPTQITDAQGDYSFSGIAPGDHRVRWDGPPADWTCSYPTPCSWSLTLEANERAQEIEFGAWTPGEISGHVFEDKDGNGSNGAGDAAWPAKTVYLDLDEDGELDAGEPSTSTDASGDYTFTGVDPGTYRVRVALGAGEVCTAPTPCESTVVVQSGDSDTAPEFGGYIAVSISGTSYEDTDASETNDPGEPVLPGASIYLDLNDDGDRDAGEPQQVSDASGDYEFTGLAPGTHVVRGETGAGFEFCSYPTGCEADVALLSGQTRTGLDFGFYDNGEISGHVFEDMNGDGDRDAGEPPWAGKTVYLDLDDDGSRDLGEPSVVTPTSGDYSFGAIRPGDYKLRVDLGPTETCSAPDPCSNSFAISSGESYAAPDFGGYTEGQISGTVYEDMDNDGAQGPGEGPLSGVDVYLDLDDDGTQETGEPVSTSDGSGNYTFADLEPRMYRLRLDLAAGRSCTEPVPCEDAVTIVSGASETGATFGVSSTGSVSGRVFEDLDADGTEDGADPDRGGQVVYLDLDDNGVLDDGEPTDTTDGSGNYSFGALDPGAYRVRVQLAAGETCSAPSPCNGNVTVNAGADSAGPVFGVWEEASVAGRVFEDLDGDGTEDAGDPAFDLRTVYLDLNDDGDLGEDEPSQLTDPSGAYSFTDLIPRTYTVRIELDGDTCSTPDPCFEAVTVQSGESGSGPVFGLYQSAEITGHVFEDEDADGIEDAGDPDLPGQDVYLDLDDDGDLGDGEPTETTDSSGGYTFTGLEPGDYRVNVDLAAGQTCSAPDPCFQTITVASGDSAGGPNFGIWTPASISGNVFEDLNANGANDSDPDWSGKTVYLDLNDDGIFDADDEPSQTTDASGNYSFTGLDPGTYRVRIDLGAGTCTAPTPCSANVLVGSGDTETGPEFGGYTTASIGGSGFEDMNGDGTEDGADPALTGQVYLDLNDDGVFDPDDDTAATLDASGNYSFPDLVPGTYTVRIDLGAGKHCSTPDPCHGTLTVESGESGSGPTFGVWSESTLSGHVFTDSNNNGTNDVEQDRAGETVYLDLNENGTRDAGEPSQSTDGNGDFAFTELAPGSYRVRLDLDAADLCTVPAPCFDDLTATSGSGLVSEAFGVHSAAGISGRVFEDVDRSGAQNGSEPGLADWAVYLDANDDGDKDAGEPETRTDAAGDYSFTVIPGAYTVRLVTRSGYECHSPAPCSWTRTLTDGEISAGNDFGAFANEGQLSGRLYEDLDASGRRAAGEPDWRGATVFVDLNRNGTRNAGEPSAATDSEGRFSFIVAPGNYTIRIVAPRGWHCSASCGFGTTVRANQNTDTGHHGAWREASARGTVFSDPNADGSREDDEPALEDRTVYADLNRDGERDEGEPSSSTDSSGTWSITGLRPGQHFREILPEGWGCSTAGGCESSLKLISGEARNNVDFANWEGAMLLNGLSFHDVDGDGRQRETGEVSLEDRIVFVDLDGDGEFDAGGGGARGGTPRSGDGAEPHGVSDENGEYSITMIPPGTFDLIQVPTTGWDCSFPANCVRSITFAAGQVTEGENFGAYHSAAKQGRVWLRARTGCRVNPMWISVRGDMIRNVTFLIDGKVVDRVRERNYRKGKRFGVKVDPADYRFGKHRITARARMSDLSPVNQVVLRDRWWRCKRADENWRR